MIFSDESGSMHISENKSNWVCIFYTGFFQKLPNLSGRKYKKTSLRVTRLPKCKICNKKL